MKRALYFFTCLWFSCCNESVFASGKMGPSYGEIADNMLGPLAGIISMVRAISIIAGICLILSCFVKVGDYRRNPHETSLAVVITQFIAGVCLVIVGFVPFGSL